MEDTVAVPKLTGVKNFALWRTVLTSHLKHKRLWDIASGVETMHTFPRFHTAAEDDAWSDRDAAARSLILCTIDPSIARNLVGIETAAALLWQLAAVYDRDSSSPAVDPIAWKQMSAARFASFDSFFWEYAAQVDRTRKAGYDIPDRAAFGVLLAMFSPHIPGYANFWNREISEGKQLTMYDVASRLDDAGRARLCKVFGWDN